MDTLGERPERDGPANRGEPELRKTAFTKMQGLGNDFIVVDGPVEFSAEEIAQLCDRRFGIGADGLLAATSGDPVRMEYWNADGSAAEMCGNGLRCVARYAYDRGWSMVRDFGVATPVGVLGVRVLDDGVVDAEVGRPEVTGRETVDGRDLHMVDVGNPHAVEFVTDPSSVDVPRRGATLQGVALFPEGVNVEFVAIVDGGVRMRVWERGVGETMACATGMVAAAAVAGRLGEVESPVTVQVPGGSGCVELRDGSAWLRGPADYSFTGIAGGR